MNRYVKRTQVKAGLFEDKFVKAKDLLKYIQKNFPCEFNRSVEKLVEFDLEQYRQFIQELDVISEAQKEWLQIIIPYRRENILEWIEKEGNHHE